jgi:hypothetical protein
MNWREMAVMSGLYWLNLIVAEADALGRVLIGKQFIAPTWGAQTAQDFITRPGSHSYCCDFVQACWRAAGFVPPWNLGSVGRMIAFARYDSKAIAGPHWCVWHDEHRAIASSVRDAHVASGKPMRAVVERAKAPQGFAPLPGDCLLHLPDRDGDGAVLDEWHGHGMLVVAASTDAVTVIEGNGTKSLGPMPGKYLGDGRGFSYERREGVGLRTLKLTDATVSALVRPSDADFEPWAKGYYNSMGEAEKARGGA